MNDQHRRDEDERTRPSEEATFAREGPNPPRNDSGQSVEEMNRKAEDALLRNVRPDEQID
jgi:hypothetical protein